MEKNNLAPVWIKSALREECKMFEELRKAHVGLKNKETDYAKGIAIVLAIRKQVVKIWYDAEKQNSL